MTRSGGNNDNRNSSNSKKKPLLMTRSEAETFLKIRMLSQEIDTIANVSEQIAARQHLSRKLQATILNSTTATTTTKNSNGGGSPQQKQLASNNPWITPILPLLHELVRPVDAAAAVDDDQKKQEENGGGGSSKTPTATATTTSQFSLALYELHSSMTEL
ncbi:MAG: hypothetical protein SGARI_007662, partial [Bacillariaceae sp.]